MNSSESTSYARQNMVRIKDKDRVIEEKKIKNKKGYDLFNTIFFERHREILMRSARRISVIILIVAVVLGFISFIFIPPAVIIASSTGLNPLIVMQNS